MCAAGQDPAVPGVSTVSRGKADLPEHEGGGQDAGQAGVASPGYLGPLPASPHSPHLRSIFSTRYLRKAFFPKHQDLQFAGKVGGLTPISHGSPPRA